MTILLLQNLDLDMCWAAKNAVDFQKELYGKDCEYSYNNYSDRNVDMIANTYVPVGTVEFVHSYMNANNIPIPDPINIPIELYKEHPLYPRIAYGPTKLKKESFVKNRTQIKHPYNGIRGHVPEGNWQITDVVKDGFSTEYRVFIFNGRIVGVKHYSGDPFIPIGKAEVTTAIHKLTNPPMAYTLDFGVHPTLKHTSLIEMHHLYSCGLYGLDAPSIYPQMLSGWWKWYLKSIEKR